MADTKKILKRKKKGFLLFFLFLFFAGILFHFTGADLAVHAQTPPPQIELGYWESTFASIIKGLLYVVFVFVGWLAGVAMTLFNWAINPEFISGSSGFLNRASVYEMWKFVRDFFNIFFILVLLYIAFTIIFQVAGDYKKTLLQIVIMALLVNFSFPITRFLIDASNVPMYFFANQMTGTGSASQGLSSVFDASRLQDILIFGSEQNAIASKRTIVSNDSVFVSTLLAATIFMFIFSVTLLVLAIMFIIRLVALIFFVVFSSVGFATSFIPGMESYSKKYWESFWQYAIFGPAAMLMLLISVRFFQHIREDQLITQFQQAAQNQAAGGYNGFLAGMAQFAIPMIMLWFTIGVANKFSIAGSGAVVGSGQKFAKWVGKKVSYDNPVGRGFKKAGYEGKVGGKKVLPSFVTPKWWNEQGKMGAYIEGGIAGGARGAKLHYSQIQGKKRSEKEKEFKDSGLANHELQEIMEHGDAVSKAAAASLLIDRKAIDTPKDLSLAFRALGDDTKDVADLIEKLSGDSLKFEIDPSSPAKMAEFKKEFDAIMSSEAFKKNPKLQDKFKDKIRKEGRARVLIEHDILTTGKTRQTAYDEAFNKMTAEDLGKMKDIHSGYGTAKDEPAPELRDFIERQTARGSYSGGSAVWSNKDHQDAYSKLNAEQKEAWRKMGINP